MIEPTQSLSLRRGADGYFGTRWFNDAGQQHRRRFGRHKAKAQARFAEFHERWQRDWHCRNPNAPGAITVARGWHQYYEHAERYYRRSDGTLTGEAAGIKEAFALVLDMAADLPAKDFGPKSLERVRDRMVARRWARNTINARINRVRRVFRWLVSQELVPADVHTALTALAPLRAGRSTARETAPVGPVPEPHVWETCEHLRPTLCAMVKMQFYTGCRPGETFVLRSIDIDMTGQIWVYSPAQHKTLHAGRGRSILIGPKLQTILTPFFGLDASAYCFTPLQSWRERCAACKTHRHQPVVAARSLRTYGERYNKDSYARAIRRVCTAHGIPTWAPNQLRHTYATRMRKAYGLERTRVLLGHAHISTTELYAEEELRDAAEIVEKTG